MKKQIDQIIELAKEFRTFSQETNDWYTQEYRLADENDYFEVRCYFAQNSDHSSVNFKDGGYGREVEIMFFEPVHIEIDYPMLTELDLILEKGRFLLQKEQLDYKARSKAEIKKKKEDKIRALKKELERLEKEKK